MDMTLDGLLGLFALGCGLYCLYGVYMLRFKNEINRSVLLPKDVNVKKCKDVKGYCKEAQPPLLLLGIVTTVYGGIDLYNTYVGGADKLFIIMLILLIPALIIYAVMIKKINEKYFGK